MRALASEGLDLVCLLRPSSTLPSHWPKTIRVIRGTLTDPVTLDQAFHGVQAVCHLAARVSDWGTVREIRSANLEATRILLEFASRHRVQRFVHVSTTDVYGHPGTRLHDENVPTHPPHFNWYAETKRQAEALVVRSDLPWTILRPATVYGPGSVSMLGEFVRALRDGFMLWVNHGRSMAGLVYVEDVVAGIRLALDHPSARGEAFNLSASCDTTWHRLTHDLADALSYSFRPINLPYPVAAGLGMTMECGYRFARALTGCTTGALLSRQAVQIMGIDQSFSHAKASRLLGYHPATDYSSGLKASVEWLRCSGYGLNA
ncbi:MAG: NAD-dependent epimerase/dehydratase family protein [Candidatus Methylacidiphilales bacterium]